MAAPVRLQTHVWNPVGGRRALLLHGIVSDGSTWWRLASELADAGWMVLAPDLRGHGRSPAAAAYDLPTLAGDVELLGSGWDLIVGHSLGGAIAAQLLARPLDVRTAVLVDPALRFEGAQDPAREDLRSLTGTLDPALVRAREPSWDERDVQREVASSALVTPDVVDAVFEQNDPWDLVPQLLTAHARVHVIGADPARGGICDPDLVRSLDGRDRVTSEVLGGCGHSIHCERPQAVTAAVERVVAGS